MGTDASTGPVLPVTALKTSSAKNALGAPPALTVTSPVDVGNKKQSSGRRDIERNSVSREVGIGGSRSAAVAIQPVAEKAEAIYVDRAGAGADQAERRTRRDEVG